ncbi:hypothetical protein [Staphylothermus hellenicus]|uniref:Uncharacterized protein n=1 Tax=Staphylothermus hellenicus (strain DSM 12710 / JCM 10830 / BK20S6-10-b1 / P8) TaxID=591019 RepID=D7D8W0_STAHD|nr:hypothetical protein [Staphylothermus hellenicus]ADI32206.1 hypothetical protein Shell_1103 [Staphylothermus hellenicus DSM 12710]
MLSLPRLINILERLLKELRRKYGETYIYRIKEYKSKFKINMIVDKNRVKIIVYKDKVKARVYAGNLRGLEISIRRMLIREYNKEMRLKQREREESI